MFNFASPASPADYARLDPETLNVGSQGARNVLDLARKYQAGFRTPPPPNVVATPMFAS